MIKTSGCFSVEAVREIVATYRDKQREAAKIGKAGKGQVKRETCIIGKRDSERVPEEFKTAIRRI